MSSRNFLIVSSIDWSVNWQIHHQLATSLINEGNRVLFMENTGVRPPRPGDLQRVISRLRNWFRSTRGFSEALPGLTLFSPLLLPLPYSKVCLLINRFLLQRALSKWMKIARFSDPIAIIFLPTPLAQALVRDLDPSLTVYYCVDNMAEGSPAARKLVPWENRLFKEADVVFCTSESIRERAERLSTSVYSFPAGVEYVKFERARENASIPRDLESLERPIVGYVGALTQVLDQSLLVEAARQIPSATFALVGPTYVDTSALESCPNVRLLGGRPHDEIPAYVKGFDVALIPYVINAFTDSVYSCKLNEYLAMGVPVVATNMRELRLFAERHGPVVALGETADQFVAKVRDALLDTSAEGRSARISVASSNSWDQRFSEIRTVLERHLEIKAAKGAGWQQSLVRLYRRGRMRFAAALLGAFTCYLLLFHTPLVWLAGNFLALREIPRQADAIVVFSGDGESSYLNPSYQKRALDAVENYKQGYAPILILSSGRQQTFAEVELMRALVMSKGVPREAIRMIESYPKNTFENVSFAHQALQQIGARKALLITAPYHSRRASLIWRHEAPEIKVTAIRVIDTPPDSPVWSASLDELISIAYEYAALVHNWCTGRLSFRKVTTP